MDKYNFNNTGSGIDPFALIGPGPDNYGRDKHFTHHSPNDEKRPYIDAEVLEIIKIVLDMNTRILDYNERLLILLEKYNSPCGNIGHT